MARRTRSALVSISNQQNAERAGLELESRVSFFERMPELRVLGDQRIAPRFVLLDRFFLGERAVQWVRHCSPPGERVSTLGESRCYVGAAALAFLEGKISSRHEEFGAGRARQSMCRARREWKEERRDPDETSVGGRNRLSLRRLSGDRSHAVARITLVDLRGPVGSAGHFVESAGRRDVESTRGTSAASGRYLVRGARHELRRSTRLFALAIAHGQGVVQPTSSREVERSPGERRSGKERRRRIGLATRVVHLGVAGCDHDQHDEE